MIFIECKNCSEVEITDESTENEITLSFIENCKECN